MNKLQKLIKDNDLNETEVLNELQDNGIISDLCVSATDVADCDVEKVEVK
jgi:hypothetical protein